MAVAVPDHAARTVTACAFAMTTIAKPIMHSCQSLEAVGLAHLAALWAVAGVLR